MRNLFAILFTFWLGLAAWAVPTRAEVLKAIAAFEANPLAPDAMQTCGRTILEFAAGSHDVMVEMGPKNFPPLSDKKMGDEIVVLTAAYMCGDLRAQLEEGKKGEQSYPSVLSMLRVYELMRKQKPGFRSPGLDRLATLETQGKLESYLRTK